MNKTVAIIGSHPTTRKEFDWSRDDCDIWVFNEAISNKTFERADAVFQIHEEAIWRNPANRNDKDHAKWLKEQEQVKVYMQEHYKDVPMSEEFPLDDLCMSMLSNVTMFVGGEQREFKYFSNSVDYALAMAGYVHKKYGNYNKVELYGVEMETNTEYQYQRTGVAYWLGYLSCIGLNVEIHASIFDFPLYGYQGEVVMPYERFDERITFLRPMAEKLAKNYQAAVMTFNKALDAFAVNAGVKEEEALFKAAETVRNIGRELGELDGAIQENQRYKEKAGTMKKETGGEFLFSRQEFESAAKMLGNKIKREETAFIMLGTTLQHMHDGIKRAAKGSPKRKKAVDLYSQQSKQYLHQNNVVAVLTGAAKENWEFMGWMDKHIKAAGGSKSEAALLEMKANANVA